VRRRFASLRFDDRASRSPAVPLAAAVITTLAFFHAFGLSPFYDDWYFATEAGRALRDHAFVRFIFSPAEQHWSPLWQAFSFLNVWAVGWKSDGLIRSAIGLMVLLGLVVLARLAARLRLSAGATVMGMSVLGLHHLNAVAYYSFDCYSQVAVDLCTWIIVSHVLVYAIEERGVSRSHVFAAAALYIPSLLLKEEGLAGLAGITALAIWFSTVERLDAERRRTIWGLWAAMLAASVVFAALRFRAGVWLDADGPYQICITCIPGNAVLFLGAIALPIPTVYAYFAMLSPLSHPSTFVVAAVGASIVVVTVARDAIACGHDHGFRRLALMATLMIVTLFPTVLLTRVGIGELHAHTALFWYAALVTMAVDGWRVRLQGTEPRIIRGALALAFLYVVALFVGLQTNLAEMRATGERAASLLTVFQTEVRHVPSGSAVIVRGLDHVKGPSDYSLYRLTTPGMLLLYGATSLQFVAPPGVTIVDDGDWPDHVAATARVGRPRTFVADFARPQLSVRELASGQP
jgi:hypothetical protein